MTAAQPWPGYSTEPATSRRTPCDIQHDATTLTGLLQGLFILLDGLPTPHTEAVNAIVAMTEIAVKMADQISADLDTVQS